jgi:hypothetical protein
MDHPYLVLQPQAFPCLEEVVNACAIGVAEHEPAGSTEHQHGEQWRARVRLLIAASEFC